MNNNLPSSHLRFARQRAASLAVSTDNARFNSSATTMRDRRGGDSQSSESVGEIPHTPGADICFCTVCHLRPTRFPRRQDGKIMLPDPKTVSAAGAASRFGGQEGTPRARTRRMTEAVQDIDTRSELGFGIGTGSGMLGGGGGGGGGSSTSSLRSSRHARTRSNAYGDLERVREDRGEGPSISTHVQSRSGMRSGTSDSHSLYSAGLDDSEVSHVGESPMHSSLRGPSRGRHSSMTDRVRPHRTSKPYEPKSSTILDSHEGSAPGINDNDSGRPDPWPRISTGNQRETIPNLPGHLPTAYSDPHHSTTTTSLAGRERREPSPNPYEALGSARNSQVADSSTSLDTREADIANSSTLPHTHKTQNLTHNRRGSESYTTTTNTTTANASNSSYYRHTSSIPFNQEQTTTTTNHYLSISAREAISPPQVIRFKSRAQNPQPEPWSVWTPNSPSGGGQPYMRPPDTGRSNENILSRTTGLTVSHARDPSTSMESVVDDIHQPHSGSNSNFQNQQPPSSQIRRGTPPHSFASSTSSTTTPHHQDFLPADTGTSSSIRFENPVTPQLHVELNSSRPPRQASGTPNSQAQTPQMQTQSQTQVPVKWDSERKRRQGYSAANDDGEEKSSFRYYNFRHYNETALQKTYLE